MADPILKVPTGMSAVQVEGLTQKQLLYGIYRAVSTIRTILVIFAVLSALGVLLVIASAGSTTP